MPREGEQEAVHARAPRLLQAGQGRCSVPCRRDHAYEAWQDVGHRINAEEAEYSLQPTPLFAVESDANFTAQARRRRTESCRFETGRREQVNAESRFESAHAENIYEVIY